MPTVSRGGRRPGRAPTELETRHLALLSELGTRATTYARVYDERLEDFVLELRETGCSARSLADAIGVSSSTVQLWTVHARDRRRERHSPPDVPGS